jgi:hypothetical protein
MSDRLSRADRRVARRIRRHDDLARSALPASPGQPVPQRSTWILLLLRLRPFGPRDGVARRRRRRHGDALGDACDPSDDRTATEVVGDALDLLEGVADSQSLTTNLEEALARISEGRVEAACGALRALISEARAQTGHKLTAAQAAALIAEAERAMARLDC